MRSTICFTLTMFLWALLDGTTQGAFVHPGCLSTQSDLDRMAAKVAANEQPWKGGWDRLVSNTGGYLDDAPLAQSTINVGGGLSENYIRLAMDCAKAYQCALRYHGSGDTAYGDKAVQIMNTWADVMTGWAGDTNVSLRSGLYGYQMACAGELMRDYPGWNPADFADFQTWMVDVFYSKNTYFLTYKHGTCDDHYWANWDLSTIASMMAIGVLCDNQAIFDEGLNYLYSGSGSGNIDNAVHYVHPDGFGQWQESGRDQGHALIGPQLMGVVCEIGWNQGIDLYGYHREKVLSGMEFIAKYNLWNDDVPWVTYITCEYEVHTMVASWGGRGAIRPGWDLIYNHYVNRLGMSAPYTQQYAELARPDGGGFNYGTTSGGFDGLGFTTLTHSLDPIANGGAPSGLLPYVKGRQITLSWRGTPYTESYNIKRSTVSGGPYTTLTTVGTKDNYYIDPGLTVNTTYYYVVSANNPDGESADSVEVSALADGELPGTVIGTDGSWNNAGADKHTVYDGSLRNFFDGPSSVSWAGLDLGEGVSASIARIKYCPRRYFSGRMVGGKFQGSNTADFSSGVTDLYTISSGPVEGVLTTQTISNPNSFRYVRYLSPSGGYGNVAEVQFLGSVSGLNAPAAPTINSADLVNGYTANLGWSVSPGATNYYIKRAATSGGPYTIIGIGNYTGLNDYGLDADTIYYYVISALNSMGQSANSNEVSVTTPPSGPTLVARYAMEGDVTDSSGYNYHATATGTPAYTIGQVGQAVDLDGTDDLVTLPSGVADSSDMTVTAWVNWDGGGAWQRIFDFGNDTNQYLFLTPYSGSVMRFAIKNGGSEQAVETTTLATGQWVHVAVTLGGNTAKLYVNGILKAANNSVTINPSDFNSRINYIGDSQWSDDPLFNGRIDDFRIYNYALTDTQIAAIAAGNTSPAFTIDPIGNLDGIELSHYEGTSLASYATDADGIETVTFSKDSGASWLVVAPDGTLSGVPGNRDIGENTFTVRAQDSEGLYDTATMTVQVVNTYSGVIGMDDLLSFTAQWLMADCVDTPACGGADLDGDSDVTLSDFAILEYNWLGDESLLLYLKFDEASGDVAGDSSIYDRPGQLINAPTWSTGHAGGALSFDGTNYVEVADDGGLNPDTNNWSVSFWIKSDIASQGAFIVSKRAAAAPFVQYSIGLSSGNSYSWAAGSKLTFLFRESAGIEKGGYTTSDIDFSDWTHVCVVLDRDANTVYVYIDGVSVPATLDHDGVVPTITNTSPLYIGRNPTVSDLAYDGLIDDVRIYDHPLTETEIQQISQ